MCERCSAPTTPGCRPTACCRPSTRPASPTSTSSCSPRSPGGLTERRRYAPAPWPRRPAPASPPTSAATQILAATHRVTLERGLHDVRVADVADELDVSTGLIHYHFATKDELIEAMLRETADLEVADRAGGPWPGTPLPQERLARVIETYLPSTAPRPVVGAVDRRVGRGAARRQPAADLRGARRGLGRADRRGHRRRRGRRRVPLRRPGRPRRGGCAPCSTASACRSCCTRRR